MTGTTDSVGQFDVRLPAGAVTVSATARDSTGRAEVELVAGDIARCELGLTRAGVFAGRVEAPEGVDVEWLTITAVGQDNGLWTTLRDGRFVVTDVEAGAYQLEIRGDDGQTLAVEPSTVEIPREGLTGQVLRVR